MNYERHDMNIKGPLIASDTSLAVSLFTLVILTFTTANHNI